MYKRLKRCPSFISAPTSGWSYKHWKNLFYTGIAQKNWLKFYAAQFSTVEINGTFYRLQSPETFSRWFDETPETFRFSIKAHHYLTHNKKLLNPEASVLIEKNHAIALQEKLAAVLWQLPATLRKDVTRLKVFLQALQQHSELLLRRDKQQGLTVRPDPSAERSTKGLVERGTGLLWVKVKLPSNRHTSWFYFFKVAIVA